MRGKSAGKRASLALGEALLQVLEHIGQTVSKISHRLWMLVSAFRTRTSMSGRQFCLRIYHALVVLLCECAYLENYTRNRKSDF